MRQETWGPFGRGWANEQFAANVVAPQPFPLIAFPRAWTPGTDGPVTGDAVVGHRRATRTSSQWAGKLQGKIVLTRDAATVAAAVHAARPALHRSGADRYRRRSRSHTGRGGRGAAAAAPPPDPNFPPSA